MLASWCAMSPPPKTSRKKRWRGCASPGARSRGWTTPAFGLHRVALNLAGTHNRRHRSLGPRHRRSHAHPQYWPGARTGNGRATSARSRPPANGHVAQIGFAQRVTDTLRKSPLNGRGRVRCCDRRWTLFAWRLLLAADRRRRGLRYPPLPSPRRREILLRRLRAAALFRRWAVADEWANYVVTSVGSPAASAGSASTCAASSGSPSSIPVEAPTSLDRRHRPACPHATWR